MLTEIIAFILGAASIGLVTYFKMKAQLSEQAQQNTLQSQAILIENSQLKEKLSYQEKFDTQLVQKVELLTQKVVDERNKSISHIIEPLREKLKDFERKVEETYSLERNERGQLKGELSKLMELNQKMSSDAQHLTLALTGDVKTQGTWGELILENILDRSGLRKDEEYTVQGEGMQIKDENGVHLKPDVIIHLPDNKHVIIDSKASVGAYYQYVSCQNDVDREKFAKLHVESIRKHIDSLGSKKYYNAERLISPDFVIMFMPLEPAFALTFQYKPELLQEAWDRNIAIVSPTTLLTTLRTIAYIWKQDRQTKNALEIAKRGGALYEKFVSLVEDFEDVGKKIQEATRAQNSVMTKLREGSGNVFRQIEMLKELGAKTEKKLQQLEKVDKEL